jgi:pyruvate dehydrogenase E1 component
MRRIFPQSGGNQASCASMTAIMAAMYFHSLRPQDKVAVKPHTGPVLQAIHYLLWQQTLKQLQRFRRLGGGQSYFADEGSNPG